jgi:hypothetical protein
MDGSVALPTLNPSDDPTLSDLLDAITSLRDAFDAERAERQEIYAYIRSMMGQSDASAERIILAILDSDRVGDESAPRLDDGDFEFTASEVIELARNHDHELARALGNRFTTAKALAAFLKGCIGRTVAGRVVHYDGKRRVWILSESV